MSRPLEICILAAGIGSRMRSNKPKALQTLAGKPLLQHLLETVDQLSPSKIHVVVGQGAEQVRSTFMERSDLSWIYQSEQKGTGHAMQLASLGLDSRSKVLILMGDAPLVQRDTLNSLISTESDLAVLTVDTPDPFNYGRIVRQTDRIKEIVEEKDASEEQKAIKEVNTGIMVCNSKRLMSWLDLLTDDNAQKELLLTDIVRYANKDGSIVKACKTNDIIEVTGVNTFSQLASLEKAFQRKKAQELMNQGLQVMDPERIDIRGTLKVGKGSSVDINSVFEGEVTIGDNVLIGPNCVISDSDIGSESIIKANSVLENAVVGANCSVGPFARLRPGTNLDDKVVVGNFVEIKKTKMGTGSKASHLTYLGDSFIGTGVNIGAGTITCNYDGINKFTTEIADGAFIGSNASLVAPVKIGARATIGAGSTITKDVKSGDLALGRGKQKSIHNWEKPGKQ